MNGQISNENIAHYRTRHVAIFGSAFFLPVSTLIPAFKDNGSTGFTSHIKCIVNPPNVTDIPPKPLPKLDVYALPHLAYFGSHCIVIVQHIFDSACRGTSYAESHPRTENVVLNGDIVGRRNISIASFPCKYCHVIITVKNKGVGVLEMISN